MGILIPFVIIFVLGSLLWFAGRGDPDKDRQWP
jgi:hypothetical protein